MKACDGLDGAEDGVISNVAGCQSTIDLQGREIIHGVNLLRLLPAGAVAGWGSHPLESAAFSRRTRRADIADRNRDVEVVREGFRTASVQSEDQFVADIL